MMNEISTWSLRSEIQPNVEEQLVQLLDATERGIRAGNTTNVMPRLVLGLHRIRRAAGARRFGELVTSICRRHAVYELFAADPFTARCRQRPRGYAGDAVTLDYIYDPVVPDSVTSAHGDAIFCFTAGASASARAVRRRRDLLASEIDAAAQRRPARVLSLACGHLREAALSFAVSSGRLEELVAVDQDPESLAEVARCSYGERVTPLLASVSDVLKRRVALGTFDLVYSAGLYDYLEQPVAAALTAELTRLLRPGGKLLVANFARDFSTQAFMEAFMDWRLLDRSVAEVAALVRPARDRQTAVVSHEDECVVYLHITRARD